VSVDKERLRLLLKKVAQGKLKPEQALEKLRELPFENIGFAKIDHHRELRQGVPEVIFCENKTPDQVVKIVRSMLSQGSNVLATRVSREIYQKIKKLDKRVSYNRDARTVVLNKKPQKKTRGKILIATGGTSDIPVAEEASVTADLLGSRVERLYDVGVAGIHRLFENKEKLFDARVIIVIAGMDGALAGVIGGLVDKPVIAVPTSVGYGANFGGLSPLLNMLNSCAAGVAVVNIDNGFGAGYLAHVINMLGEPDKCKGA